jgi:hypothetical protein
LILLARVARAATATSKMRIASNSGRACASFSGLRCVRQENPAALGLLPANSRCLLDPYAL